MSLIKNCSMRRRALSLLLSVIMIVTMIPAVLLSSNALGQGWEIYVDGQEGWWRGNGMSNIFSSAEAYRTGTSDLNRWIHTPGNLFAGVLTENCSFSYGSDFSEWSTGSHDEPSEPTVYQAEMAGFDYTISGGTAYHQAFDEINMTIQNGGTYSSTRTTEPTIVVSAGILSFHHVTVSQTGTSGPALEIRAGGEVNVKEDAVITRKNGAALINKGTLNVTGGTIVNLKNEGDITVTGGTFDYATPIEGCSFDSVKAAVGTDYIIRLDSTTGNGIYTVMKNENIVSGTFMDKVPNIAIGATMVENADGTHTVTPPASHTVTYDLNGGNGTAPTAATVYEGHSYTVDTSTIPTRTGHNFKGWGTTADGTPVTEVTVNADVTLYAIWEAKSYTVTFYANGGVGTLPSPETVTWGSDYTVPGNTTGLTKDGLFFGGWSIMPGMPAETSIHVINNISLFAIWTTASYTVSFDANGATGTVPATVNIGEGSTYVIPGNTTALTKEGCEFDGWALSADGDVITQTDVDSDITLYAIWSVAQYTVTYQANEGENAPASATVTYGDSFNISETVPVRKAYTFDGWSDGTSTYQPGDALTVTANVTLTAVWTANPCMVPMIQSNVAESKLRFLMVVDDISAYYRVGFLMTTDASLANEESMTLSVDASGKTSSDNDVFCTTDALVAGAQQLVYGSILANGTPVLPNEVSPNGTYFYSYTVSGIDASAYLNETIYVRAFYVDCSGAVHYSGEIRPCAIADFFAEA